MPFSLDEVDQSSDTLWLRGGFPLAYLAKAQLDLLILKNGKRIGYEFKYSDAPKITPSMRIACEDLKLDHLYVVYPGT